MVQAKVLSLTQGTVASAEVDVAALGDATRRRLLRAVVLGYQANARQGTHSTKTRAEVRRSERKPFRQKGTGRARAGDFASPLWRGGGIIHGPKPRSYRQKLSVKTRREALRSAVFGKFADGEAAFLRDVAWSRPSTKSAAGALRSLGVEGEGALVVLPRRDEVLYRSFRNLPRVDVLPASDVNAYQVLRRRWLVLIDDALQVIEGRLQAGRSRTEEAADGQ